MKRALMLAALAATSVIAVYELTFPIHLGDPSNPATPQKGASMKSHFTLGKPYQSEVDALNGKGESTMNAILLADFFSSNPAVGLSLSNTFQVGYFCTSDPPLVTQTAFAKYILHSLRKKLGVFNTSQSWRSTAAGLLINAKPNDPFRMSASAGRGD